jgi:hypothetical protein
VAKTINDVVGASYLILDVEMVFLQVCGPLLKVFILRPQKFSTQKTWKITAKMKIACEPVGIGGWPSMST